MVPAREVPPSPAMGTGGDSQVTCTPTTSRSLARTPETAC